MQVATKLVFGFVTAGLTCLLLASCMSTGDLHRLTYTPHSTSELYNDFRGGVLFTDVGAGLDTLWQASYIGRRPYRENVAFFVEDGLLILPNSENTRTSGKLGALKLLVENGMLYVLYEGMYLRVSAVIHTHPDPMSLPIPAPGNDYQFHQLGIHNYIMDCGHLMDAYVDDRGFETYQILGKRTAYTRIPAFGNRANRFVASDK